MNDLALILDLFGNSEETQVIDMHGDFLSGVYSVSEMDRVELRAKIGQYRNRCFIPLFFMMVI